LILKEKEDKAMKAIKPNPAIMTKGGEAMFNKILVPLDGPEWEAKVLPHVEDLAKACQAEVTFFNTATYGSKDEIGEVSSGVIEEAVRRVKEETEKHLVEIANSFKAKGIRAHYVYQEEMPARESIAYAEKDNGDLIALADHGKRDLAWIFGGVASTDDLKRTSLTNKNWVIAVAVGLLISISPLLIAMLFM
jgi:nucleotide-binding universal stress UspA family protein